MNIKLINNVGIIEEVMPEITKLFNDNISIKISNFKTLTGRLSLRVSTTDRHYDYEVRNGEVEIPVSVLTKELKSVAFTLNNKSDVRTYIVPADKLQIKGIINIKEGDTLLELLRVLYNKYVVLEKKYEQLDKIVNEGDLLI